MQLHIIRPPEGLVLSEVMTDGLFAQLIELSRHNTGHEFDYLLCQPAHNYWQLEEMGMVTISAKDHPTHHLKIARLTAKGASHVGVSRLRRRARRRRLRG